MTNGFARRKEQSKGDIRRAAWELFSQFGVERVSMADIARKAGVSQATIYNNFGSKDVLTREFVTTVVNQLVDRVQQVLAPDRPYWEKITAFMQFIAEIMAHEHPSAADGTVFTASEDLQQDPEIREIRNLAQERMTCLLLAMIQEGKEQGQISGDLSEEAYRVYFGALMGMFTDPHLQHRFYRDSKLVQDLGTLMVCGLGGRPR